MKADKSCVQYYVRHTYTLTALVPVAGVKLNYTIIHTQNIYTIIHGPL